MSESSSCQRNDNEPPETTGSGMILGPSTAVDFVDAELESRIRQIGGPLVHIGRGRSVLSSTFWSDKLMDWATKDPAFKHQLFQFIAIYPSLKSPREVHEVLMDHLTQPGVNLGWMPNQSPSFWST